MFDAVTYAAAVSAARKYTDTHGGPGTGPTTEYVDKQDKDVLTSAKNYTNDQSKLLLDKIKKDYTTLYVEIMTEVDHLVCDHTAQQITSHSLGQVIARYTDEPTGEVREYVYFKRMKDGRACFTKDGYIEQGVPKQTLFYVDFKGNVTIENREALSLGITGAKVGQYVKIKAVDKDGHPTAYEAVDNIK